MFLVFCFVMVRVLSSYLVLSLCNLPCTRSRCNPSLASAPGGREGEVRARCVKWFFCRKFLRLTSFHFLALSSGVLGGGCETGMKFLCDLFVHSSILSFCLSLIQGEVAYLQVCLLHLSDHFLC